MNINHIVRNAIAISLLLGLGACGGSSSGGSGSSGSSSAPVSPAPSPSPNAKCIITNETAGGGSRVYEYDSQGMPLKITSYGPGGSPGTTTNIRNNGFETIGTSPSSGYGYIDDIWYMVSLFAGELPYMAQVSATTDITPTRPLGITQVNYKQYFFFYDDKGRLNKIGEQTNYVGDREWDLNIFYDDKNNVTGLQYVWTTGPNEVIPPVIVTGYDDKPTPYASINIWRFLMTNWESNELEPILTALSSNNPLGYTTGTFTRTMAYKYNEHGFPVERSNTNADTNSNPPGATYTFVQNFSYACN